MERPALMATTASDETFAGITYHLDGELVPALTVELLPEQKIFFEHHILLWMNTGIKIGIKPMKGALKRMIAGMQIFVTEASGPGQIAFSRDAAGHAIEETMADIAEGLVRAGVRRLVVAGGETSGAVVDRLGIPGFLVGEEIAAGVPVLRAVGAKEGAMVLALKSGNFGGPQFFSDALGLMR